MSTADAHATDIVTSPSETALAGRGPHIFFVLAALYGALILVEWVVAVRMQWTNAVPPTMWHAHEMVYGFGAAGVAGVLAAWMPRWSGAASPTHIRLVLLATIWVLGRIAMAVSGLLPSLLVAVVDLSFLAAFALFLTVPHVAARPERNLPLLAVLAVLFLGNAMMHSEAFGATFASAERGARIGIDCYLLLIAVIGGGAITDATDRYLRSQGSRATARSMPLIDGLAIAALLLYALSDSIAGISYSTSAAALLAAILNGTRLWFWHGYRVRGAASVSILHLGYLWMVVGLAFEAAVPITNSVADMAAIHVLSAGAIGTTLVAAISHESLAHSRHGSMPGLMMIAAYGLVSFAVVFRIAALFIPGGFVELIIVSGAVWALGFVLLLGTYLPPRGGRQALREAQTS